MEKTLTTATRYLTERQVSELTGISVSTLQSNRWLHRGFPFIKFGKSVRYAEPDIHACMEAARIVPTDSSPIEGAA